jgi:hypothetical protein
VLTKYSQQQLTKVTPKHKWNWGGDTSQEYCIRVCLVSFQVCQHQAGPKRFSCSRRQLNREIREGSYTLAFSYETGSGTAKDGVKALQLISEAADAGVLIAQLNLARYYWTGEGAKVNRTLATKWFESAKENIDETTDYDTCVILAESYINGWCCEPDLVAGYYWTAIAYRDRHEHRAAQLRV